MRKTNTPPLKRETLFLVTLVVLLMYHAPGAETAEPPGLIEGARKERTLMIYSLLAVPDHSRIVNRFKEKYPFIEVSFIRPGASERITTRVVTEARTGQHLVDVITKNSFSKFSTCNDWSTGIRRIAIDDYIIDGGGIRWRFTSKTRTFQDDKEFKKGRPERDLWSSKKAMAMNAA
jgi:hypothetical protein